jgi:tetratricopeptide (TPR) repeat protein
MHLRTLLLLTIPILARFWSAFVPSASPEDLMRRGNAAYERGDYEAAAAAYTEAEARTTDPGLAAVNKAAALYQKGLYRDAELHYRCCLEDAKGQRRTHALYGLGNALLQQSHERGADVLRAAILAYERCLAQNPIDAALADDARHNLELAKLLLLRVPPRNSDTPDKKPDDPEERDRPPEPRPRPDQGLDQLGTGKADASGEKRRARQNQTKDATKSDEGTAGAGTQLPPVPDQDEMAPLSREDAEEHLQRAVAKILSERRAHHQQRRPRGTIANGLDW